MIGRGVARLLVAIALLCASVAWTGWVILHTVADPSRSEHIARAVLDDPTAREQIAGDLASSLAEAVNAASASAGATTGTKVPRLDGDDPALNAAMLAAVSDQRVVRNLIDAFTAEHANILGADPKKDASIDTAVLLDAVTATLAPANPELAARITAAAPKTVKLPDIEIPFVASARDFLATAVPRLAALAAILVAVALAVGHRPTVLRRVGIWGITAGLLWVVVPRVLVWAAEQWAPGNAAVVRAVLEGATGVVSAMAALLVVVGAGCVVLGILLERAASARAWARRREGAGRTPPPRERATASAPTSVVNPGWRPFTGRDMPPSTTATTANATSTNATDATSAMRRPPPAASGERITYGPPPGRAPGAPRSPRPAPPRSPAADATTVFRSPPAGPRPAAPPPAPPPGWSSDPTTVFALDDEVRPVRRPRPDPASVFDLDDDDRWVDGADDRGRTRSGDANREEPPGRPDPRR